MVKILLVCMGNICRSPMAEGVLRHLLEEAGLSAEVTVDSAGTHSYHVGAMPDRRGQKAAIRRGVDLSAIRARRVVPGDLETFDYILAMDRDNYRELLSLCSLSGQREKINLFMEYATGLAEQEVPDPYYGGLDGFDRVMDMVEDAAQGLIRQLRQRYRL